MAAGLAGPVGLYVRCFVPLEYREAFAGDMLEQSSKRALAEMVRSLPSLLAMRVRSVRDDGAGPLAAVGAGLAFLAIAIAVLQWAGRGGTSPQAVLAGLSFAAAAYLPIGPAGLPVLILAGALVGSVSKRAPLRDASLLWLALAAYALACHGSAGSFHGWHESLRLLLPLPFVLAGSALPAPRRRRLA
ncbi:MAG TPA: hypothetical protein VIG46_10860 [Candidatus Baltobacteraceae bacterium]|jgi:hypothetical protein